LKSIIDASTASQPQKGARQQTSTAPVGPSWRRLAVGPILAADWALDPPAVTSVSAPDTRSLIFVDRGMGPGVRPGVRQVSPKGAGGQGGLGSSRFSWRGSDRRHRRRAGGARRSAARKRGNLTEERGEAPVGGAAAALQPNLFWAPGVRRDAAALLKLRASAFRQGEVAALRRHLLGRSLSIFPFVVSLLVPYVFAFHMAAWF
jgi:hypothetical protein